MDSVSLLGLTEQMATLRALAVLSWVGFTLAIIATFVEHRRWRAHPAVARCALDVTIPCPPSQQLSALMFDTCRAIAITMLWDGVALLVLLAVPSLARVPVIEGKFAMATSTALLFEGGFAGAIFFVVARLGEHFGWHRWQQPA